jgi:hypothetical protein
MKPAVISPPWLAAKAEVPLRAAAAVAVDRSVRLFILSVILVSLGLQVWLFVGLVSEACQGAGCLRRAFGEGA